jgi:hypothetical protein
MFVVILQNRSSAGDTNLRQGGNCVEVGSSQQQITDQHQSVPIICSNRPIVVVHVCKHAQGGELTIILVCTAAASGNMNPQELQLPKRFIVAADQTDRPRFFLLSTPNLQPTMPALHVQ